MRCCTKCGTILNDEATFCPNCHYEIQVNDNRLFCTQCGKELKATDRFCTRCGTPLNDITQRYDHIIAESENNVEKEKHLLYIIVVLVIIIICMGGLFYCRDAGYTNNSTRENVTDTSFVDSSYVDNLETIDDEQYFEEEDNLDWLQGNWVYDGGSYKGYFTIQGNTISQYSTLEPEPYDAKFQVEDDELRARISDGVYLTVKLDKFNHRIDWGDGQWMHKTSSSEKPSSNYSTSSKTFVNEQYVIMYLVNQTFKNGSSTIQIDSDCRMYLDGDYVGVLSVLRYNSKSAMLRYGGGAYGEGKIGVSIVNDKLKLNDPIDGTVWYQN